MNVRGFDALRIASIVADAGAGDEAAFTRLVAEYHPHLLRVAVVVTGDADLASDAVQATWQIAWRKLGSLKDVSLVRAWLSAIAANEARQIVRRQRRRAVLELAVPSADQPHTDPAEAIARVDLVNALRRLSADDRELLALRYIAGLDATEIAAIRGGSASGKRARLARLLARLRKELDRD